MMKRPVLFVDHPLLAEGFAAALAQHTSGASGVATAGAVDRLPPDALVLIEIELPEGECGLRLALQLLHERPDLTPIVWTLAPSPLQAWAATAYRLPAMLDKRMPPPDFLRWLATAADGATAWPLPLLAAAREWDAEVAPRLRALRPIHWGLWISLVRGRQPSEIAPDLSLSRRTFQRRLEELQQILGAEERHELVCRAWQWRLATRNGEAEWVPLLSPLFELPAR